jgi:hypothetical protein
MISSGGPWYFFRCWSHGLLRCLSIYLLCCNFASAANAPALLLFGDTDHRTFLGCLNCNQFDSNSVCDQFGHYGSEFSSESIWDEFGHFGSRFSSDSPWNEFASSPPVIVDKQGNFYGYFSSNSVQVQRTRIPWAVTLLDAAAKVDNLAQLRDAFCRN